MFPNFSFRSKRVAPFYLCHCTEYTRMSGIIKVYTLTVSLKSRGSLLDWQRTRLRHHGYTKRFATLDAANRAMLEVAKQDPPSQHTYYETSLREEFAFRDPLQPEQWHVLVTQPSDIISDN